MLYCVDHGYSLKREDITFLKSFLRGTDLCKKMTDFDLDELFIQQNIALTSRFVIAFKLFSELFHVSKNAVLISADEPAFFAVYDFTREWMFKRSTEEIVNIEKHWDTVKWYARRTIYYCFNVVTFTCEYLYSSVRANVPSYFEPIETMIG